VTDTSIGLRDSLVIDTFWAITGRLGPVGPFDFYLSRIGSLYWVRRDGDVF
jgi:hypothetical protein